MIDNLKKWQQICIVMGEKKSIEVIKSIMIKLQESSIEESSVEIKQSQVIKLSDSDKIKDMVEAYNKHTLNNISHTKCIILKDDIDIINIWDGLTDAQKNKCMKNELLAIYNILYKPNEIKCTAKNKKAVIDDINYFIKEEKRNNAMKNSSLIG